MGDAKVWEFRINQSKARNGLIVGAVGAAAGLAWLLFGGEELPNRALIGGVIVLLGAGVAWHGYRLGRARGPYLRIDRDGVYFREWGLTVPWREIEDVYQSGSRMQPFVTLMVRDAQRFQANLSEDEARAIKANRLWKSPELRIPYTAVEASRDELLTALGAGQDAFGQAE